MSTKPVHHIGNHVEIHARLTERQIEALKGVVVSYEVIRGGQRVQRTGSIGRIDNRFIWISGWLYWLEGELHNVRRA